MLENFNPLRNVNGARQLYSCPKYSVSNISKIWRIFPNLHKKVINTLAKSPPFEFNSLDFFFNILHRYHNERRERDKKKEKKNQ